MKNTVIWLGIKRKSYKKIPKPENDLVPKSRDHRTIEREITPGTIRLPCCDQVRELLRSLAIMQTHRDLHPILLRTRSRTKGTSRDEIWGQQKPKKKKRRQFPVWLAVDEDRRENPSSSKWTAHRNKENSRLQNEKDTIY